MEVSFEYRDFGRRMFITIKSDEMYGRMHSHYKEMQVDISRIIQDQGDQLLGAVVCVCYEKSTGDYHQYAVNYIITKADHADGIITLRFLGYVVEKR